MKTKTKTNARRKPITVTLTLNVTKLLAHLTVLAYKVTWEMVCSVLVRKLNFINFLELDSLVHILNSECLGAVHI